MVDGLPRLHIGSTGWGKWLNGSEADALNLVKVPPRRFHATPPQILPNKSRSRYPTEPGPDWRPQLANQP